MTKAELPLQSGFVVSVSKTEYLLEEKMVELIEFLKPALFGAPLMTVLYGIRQIWEKTPDQST
jgi:hypothetical protein